MIVGLDTQANCSLIKDLPLVDSLESNLDLIPINGIENAGGFVAGQLGNFTEFNVEAFFDTRAPCNILSFSEVAQKHRIEFSSENNSFTVWRYPYKYDFDNLNGVYTRDFSILPAYQMYRTVQDATTVKWKLCVFPTKCADLGIDTPP